MIDLNSASQADLDAVPGLDGHGFEIVRYREERGCFSSLDQLDEVPGLCGKLPPDLAKHLHIANGPAC